MATDPRFMAAEGREVFIGNELLVKGCLESEGGVHLMTGYPGSPVAGFFDCMGDISAILKDKGVRAFQANNEALSIAAVNGSQMAPCRAVAAFKSVGVHVAADALALGNLRLAHERLVMLGRKTASERIASFLMEMDRRLGRQKPPVLQLPMCRTDIADHLGLTVETVCRVLAHMKRDGMVAITRTGVELRDRAALRALACDARH